MMAATTRTRNSAVFIGHLSPAKYYSFCNGACNSEFIIKFIIGFKTVTRHLLLTLARNLTVNKTLLVSWKCGPIVSWLEVWLVTCNERQCSIERVVSYK